MVESHFIGHSFAIKKITRDIGLKLNPEMIKIKLVNPRLIIDWSGCNGANKRPLICQAPSACREDVRDFLSRSSMMSDTTTELVICYMF